MADPVVVHDYENITVYYRLLKTSTKEGKYDDSALFNNLNESIKMLLVSLQHEIQ